MRRILVTGATGFVGTALCRRLLADRRNVRGTLLPGESPSSLVAGVESAVVEPLEGNTRWVEALRGVDTVIHLAARVHVMNDPSPDPLAEFRRVNVEGTARLAREAAAAGVKRLVFASSVKVNGEESETVYSPKSRPLPSDPYGISKWEAEQVLRALESETGIEVAIVRPTLVYGPGVKGNFLEMMRTIRRGVPLPLASIRNRRSLIYLGNLADALSRCADSADAAGRTYLLSDGEDVSTPELVARTARAMGSVPRLWHVPTPLLNLAGLVAGRRDTVSRLAGSLAVDGSAFRIDTGWTPPFSMEEGLHETAEWFNEVSSRNIDLLRTQGPS